MYLNQNIILINTLPRELEHSEANKMTHARKLTTTAEDGTFTRKMLQKGPMCRPALPLTNLASRIDVSSPSLSFPHLCKRRRIITPVLVTRRIVVGANEQSPSLCTIPSNLAAW